ncbi:MAG TPA: hypothetical protein VLF91_04545 [Candidatus Saccharimonadales bacterium]|nr:hypothetical protein [Candidatus Saccharimonadales bacterium]
MNDMYQYQQQVYDQVRREINAEDKSYLLGVSDKEYIEHMVRKYSLGEVSINPDSLQISDTKEIVTEVHDRVWGPTEAKHVQYVCEIAYSGEKSTFELKASSGLMWNIEVNFMPDNVMTFKIDDYMDNNAQVKSDIKHTKSNLIQKVNELNGDIRGYNNQLRNTVATALANRKVEIQKHNAALLDLGIPVKKKEQVSETFAIPVENRKTRITIENIEQTKTAPQAVKPTLPDPTLADSIYQEIITTTHDVGKVMERLPKLYTDRDENSMRDLFLLYLEPRFTSAGGETFNGAGKTDILIRYKNSNVFIAEFKYWEGKKLFVDAISQLFSYLTWRDSKAALIVFNRNKDHTAVVDEISSIVQGHACFVAQKETIEGTWLNYVMHFPDDSSKSIRLAVQVFHLK